MISFTGFENSNSLFTQMSHRTKKYNAQCKVFYFGYQNYKNIAKNAALFEYFFSYKILISRTIFERKIQFFDSNRCHAEPKTKMQNTLLF